MRYATALLLVVLSQATDLYQQARYEEAKRVLASSTDADSLLLLGKIAVTQDDDRASEILERAAKAKPSSPDIHYWLGTAYRSEMMRANLFRQPSLAGKMREHLERAVELDPNHYDARIALIDYFVFAPSFAGGSEEKAIQHAAEVKRRDRVAGHRAYARLYTRQKKLDLARKEYVDGVREEPASPRAHATLSGFYAATGKNYAQAFAEAAAALKLDPNYMPALFRVGQAAALSGTALPRGEEALVKYLAWRPVDDDPTLLSAHFYLGLIYEKEGKKADAHREFTTVLRATPKWKQAQEAADRVK